MLFESDAVCIFHEQYPSASSRFLFHWAVKNLCFTRYVPYDPLLAEYINTEQGHKFTEELR